MSTVADQYLFRISVQSGVRSGRPCIQNTCVTVQEIFRWLASGATEEQILNDYPYLERDDFKAIFAYATQFPDIKVSGL